jgi:ankyrin repeat protein
VSPRLVSKTIIGRRKTFGAAGETALAIAACHGQRRAVEFLLKAGASAASRPSPLPGAVHKGDLAIVRRLLDAGADPNAFGPHGHAALHAACVYGRLSMIRLLLARGARVDLRDREYDATPVGWAEYHHHAKAVALVRGLA